MFGFLKKKKSEEELYLEVYNNGTPMEADMVQKINGMNKLPLGEMKNCFPDKRHGYGVVNILTRLRLKYGDGAAFYCRAQEDGTTCTIKIPGGDGQEAYEQEQIQI